MLGVHVLWSGEKDGHLGSGRVMWPHKVITVKGHLYMQNFYFFLSVKKPFLDFAPSERPAGNVCDRDGPGEICRPSMAPVSLPIQVSISGCEFGQSTY